MDFKGHILWADDEINMLKSHILYLENKGYHVTPVNSGEDAIQLCGEKKFDILLLDEMMTGLDGITTLKFIKEKDPGLPVIMITKNEEESLMEEAIAAQITRYLTKPVNPSQILIACKDILETYQIQSAHVIKGFLDSFNHLSFQISKAQSIQEWYKILEQLVECTVKFDHIVDSGVDDLISEQWVEANQRFGKFVELNYHKWVTNRDQPILSPDLCENFILKHLIGDKICLVVMDCLRVDQMKSISGILAEKFHINTDYYLSILPTATPYSRNAIFSGLYPSELQSMYPELWKKMWNSEKTMNGYEELLFRDYLNKKGFKSKSMLYNKITNYNEGNRLLNRIAEFKEKDIIALVVNFVDMLGHSSSESKIVREIIPDESGYRKAICSWFENAWLLELLIKVSSFGYKIFITSDHGSTKINKPVKIIGDKETSTSLRYKFGRNLNLSQKYAYKIIDPHNYKLPNHGLNTDYIIAKGGNFFVYPNNFHKYSNRFYDSFQHGGISLEEMIVPISSLVGKNL